MLITVALQPPAMEQVKEYKLSMATYITHIHRLSTFETAGCTPRNSHQIVKVLWCFKLLRIHLTRCRDAKTVCC